MVSFVSETLNQLLINLDIMTFKIIKQSLFTITALALIGCSKSDDGNSSPPQNQAPQAFQLSVMPNNATNVGLSPTFDWVESTDPDGDTVTYSLYMDTQNPPATLVQDNITETGFEIIEPLSHYTTYYWKVVATDGQATTESSSVFSFTTRGLNLAVEATSSAGFIPRRFHQTVSFNNKVCIWIRKTHLLHSFKTT